MQSKMRFVDHLERAGSSKPFFFSPRDGFSATARGLKLDHWDDFSNKKQVNKHVALLADASSGWVSSSLEATTAKICGQVGKKGSTNFLLVSFKKKFRITFFLAF